MTDGTIVLLSIWGVCALVSICTKDNGVMWLPALATLFWGLGR